MYKKIAVSITILLALLYLSSISDAGLHFGIIDAIKQKGEELKEKVEDKREEENEPPNTPSNPSPANGAPNQSINVNLRWTGGDPDPGDRVVYDVYFGTETSPPLKSSGQPGTTYDPGTLSYGTTYYWKIVAKDNHGSSTSGSVWSFETLKAWGTAQLIETDNAGNAFDPQIAMDQDGDGIAVWRQHDGTRYSIWANRYE